MTETKCVQYVLRSTGTSTRCESNNLTHATTGGKPVCAKHARSYDIPVAR